MRERTNIEGNTKGWAWACVRALMLGIGTTLILTLLLVAFRHTTRWIGGPETQRGILPAPVYLGDLAPAPTGQYRYVPDDWFRVFWITDFFAGVDCIEYTYGNPDVDWDFQNQTLPPKVFLDRYRYGWPCRAIYWDQIHTATSTKNPQVAAFHKRAYQRVGSRRGIDRPAWMPSWIGLYRIPITPIWTGVAVNIVFWSIFWILAACGWRWMSTYKRRKLGLCLRCGYEVEDLVICPECGVEVDGIV